MPPGGSRPRPRPLSPGSACPSPARSISSRTTTLQQKGLRTSVPRPWESPADRLRAEVGTFLYLLADLHGCGLTINVMTLNCDIAVSRRREIAGRWGLGVRD